ncbi:MAG: ATP-binding protein, partial [Psychroflexus sp.]
FIISNLICCPKIWGNYKLKQKVDISQVDYRPERNLDKNQLLRLQTCDWIHKHRNILITGPTGAGNVKHMII